jgi:hypothetical protein
MAGEWQRLASWLIGLSLMLSQIAYDVSRTQFLSLLIKIRAIDMIRATH